MKLIPKFDAKNEINYSTIIKHFNLKKDFFEKYLNKFKKEKSCPICNNTDLLVIADQYRQFLFSDFTELDKDTKHYFNNIKFQINNEKQVMCTKCGLIFSNCNYDYQFFIEYMQIHDGSDPSSYSEDLLSVDKYYAISKHINRVKIFNEEKYQDFKIGKKKFLEISSYRSWALDELKNDFDVYGIEPHSQSIKFSNSKFPYLSNKITNNLFELEEYNFLAKHKPFDVVLFSMCFRHMPDPYYSLKILEEITNKDSIVIIDESEFIDNICDKINSQQNTVEDFQHQFQHGKLYYYSSVHIKSLMGQYSFKLIDEYQTQDERYPTLTQSILVFKKQENYKENFTEELLRNYQNVKIIYENQDIFSKFLPNQFLLFSIE
jgi:predicted transcriptional regulator/ubiquinone/menaquinone biosynthesis C-methylase UbiE